MENDQNLCFTFQLGEEKDETAAAEMFCRLSLISPPAVLLNTAVSEDLFSSLVARLAVEGANPTGFCLPPQ